MAPQLGVTEMTLGLAPVATAQVRTSGRAERVVMVPALTLAVPNTPLLWSR
jgi:hypothetical protein